MRAVINTCRLSVRHVSAKQFAQPTCIRVCGHYSGAFQPKRHFSGTSDSESPTSPGFVDVPGVQTAGDKMIIMFTCTVCDTRSARKISKQAYTEGIVMVRCGGCNNRHLIADRLGVFEDSIEDQSGEGLQPGTGWDIQKYLTKELGENSKYITDENVYELTMKDIVGAKAATDILNQSEPNDEPEKK